MDVLSSAFNLLELFSSTTALALNKKQCKEDLLFLSIQIYIYISSSKKNHQYKTQGNSTCHISFRCYGYKSTFSDLQSHSKDVLFFVVFWQDGKEA